MNAVAGQKSKLLNLNLKFLAGVTIVLPLLFYAFSLLRLMMNITTYPWELDQGEGHNVWSAWLLWHGRGPYLDLNHYPFFGINYPPLHYVLMGPLLAIFGASLTAGRLLADLCVFGLAAGVGAGVWRYSRHHRWATGLAVLLMLANPYLYIFGTLATVNVSQVMFGLWGLYCLGWATEELTPTGQIVPRQRLNRTALGAGLVLLMAAVYTKQQAVDAVVAGFLFLLWRRPRLAILAGIGFGLLGGGLFLLLDRLTAHQFYINLVVVNLNDFLPRQLREQGLAYALTHAPLLLLAAGYGFLTLRVRSRLSLWLIYLVCTAAFSVTVGKFGASETYFYASIAAVAIAASLCLAHFWPEVAPTEPPLMAEVVAEASATATRPNAINLVSSRRTIFWLIVGLLWLQSLIFYHTPETPHPWQSLIKGHSGNYGLFGGLVTDTERAAGQRLADALRNAGPPVLTEEASFAMVNGYEVVTNPSNILVYNQAKQWQGMELTDLVKNRCFSAMLLHGHFLPDAVQQASQTNYRLDFSVKLSGGQYEIWLRRSPPDPAINCPQNK